MNEAQLIEQFTDALGRNPDAPIPPGLDVQTAAAVRAMVQLERTPALEESRHARMWHRALAQAEANQDVRTSTRADDTPGTNIRVLKPHQRLNIENAAVDNPPVSLTLVSVPGTRPREGRYVWQYALTLTAAILVIGFVGTLLIQMANSNPKTGSPGSAVTLTETPTDEPLQACDPLSTDYMPKGEANIRSGDYKTAYNDYLCASTVDTSNYDAYLIAGGLAAARGDYDQLGYDYYKFIIHNQGIADTSLATVTNLLPTIKAALEDRPDDPVLYLLRGLILTSILLDEPTDMARVMELAPDNPVPYLFSRNWPYFYQPDDPDLQKAIELAPENALLDFWLSRGLSADNAAFAIPYYDRAIEANRAHPFAYQARAVAEIYLEDMENAARDFYQHTQYHRTDDMEIMGLSLGEQFTFAMLVEGVVRMPFDAQAGQKLNFTLTRADGRFPSTIVVLDPQGKVMTVPYVLDDTTKTPSIVGLEIAESGTYSLLLKSNSDTKLCITMTAKP